MFFKSCITAFILLAAANLLISQQLPVERIWHPFSEEKNISNSHPDISSNKNYDVQLEGPLKFVPGEILISYKLTGYDESRGSKILEEYNKVVNVVRRIISSNEIDYKPVSSFIVSKMISENKTESEIRNEVRSQQLMKHKKLSSINQRSDVNNSQTILVKLKDVNDENLLGLIEKLKASEEYFVQNGIIPAYIEPNFISYINYKPNDPYYSFQWGLVSTDAETGWDIEQGSHDIKIGVIDTGVDITHEDLIDNIDFQLSYDFVDIDTSSYKGLLLNGEDYLQKDSLPIDFNGHGTHCAGIIGAKGNNGKGITGVAPGIRIVPLRAGFTIKNGSSDNGVLETDDIINAIDYAVLNGINVLSMSFGSSSYSGIYDERIQNALKNNVVLIAAAGNSGIDIKNYPAAYKGVIAVAASDENDKKASFSNYGNWIDICAPGTGIYSTVPKFGGSLTSYSGYRYISGTSMAAPFAAGLAGLILSRNQNAAPELVEYILRSTSELPKEKTFYFGAGRINIHNALLSGINDSPDIQAAISNVIDDQIIRGSIVLYGSATGDTYRVEAGSGVYPESWTVLKTGTRVMNGLLGTLDLSTFPSGKYTLRVVTEKQGFSAEYRLMIRIVVNELSKPGFPIKVPVTPDAYLERSILLVDDLENDGKKEIFVSSGRSLICYDHNGVVKQGWPVNLPQYGAILLKPCVFDINNDGYKEIFTLGLVSRNTYVYAFDYKGAALQGWPIQVDRFSLSSIEMFMSVEDLDGDQEYEIIVYAALNASPAIMVFNKNGEMKAGWPYYFDPVYEGRSKPVIADIDKDGKKEIIITAFHRTDPNGKKNKIIAIDYAGMLKPNFSYNLNDWGWSMAGGDINNDGDIEIMSQEALLSSNGTKLTWNLINTCSYSPISLGNVLNGPELEIFFGNADGKAYLTDCMGNTQNGWPIRYESFTADGNHIIADVNGDGINEIIISWVPNTLSSWNQKPGLTIYDLQGKMLDGYPKYKDQFYFSNILVDDLDDDGRSELISYSIDDHELYVTDLDARYNPHNREWPATLHNNRNTNNYNSEVNYPLLYNLKEIVIKEDETANIQFAPGYLDFSSHTADALADTSAIELIKSNSSLSLIPGPNWNGSAEIDLIVASETERDSCRFKLTVLPVNDPLGKFGLLELEDSTLVTIDSLTIDDTLSFSWEAPENVDADSLYYSISFSNELKFLNSNSLAGNSIRYSLRDICDTLSAEKIEYADVQWTVKCTNHKDTVQAENPLSFQIERLISTGLPPNQPPGFFNLSQMTDSSVVISSESVKDSITFMWEKSFDKDSDSLFYSIVFSGDLDYLNTDSLVNNYISFPVKYFDDYLSSRDTNYTKVQWRVSCTDGKDTTESSNFLTLEIKKLISAVSEQNIPGEIFLAQNYPNPFNPVTKIEFGLTGDSHVTLKVYNALGQLVSVLVDEHLKAGYHSISFEADHLASGIYIYQMRTGTYIRAYKMLLVQ